MKRLIAMLLASAVAMGLGACGASDGASSSAPSGTFFLCCAVRCHHPGRRLRRTKSWRKLLKSPLQNRLAQGSSRLPLRRRPPVRLRHSLLRLPLKQANRFPSTVAAG